MPFPYHIMHPGYQETLMSEVGVMTSLVQFLCTIVLATGLVYAFLRSLGVQIPRFWNSIQFFTQVRGTNGPKGWPLVGAVPELARNFHRIHDWLVPQLEKHHTITVPMIGTQETYFTCDVDNVRYILKTNFENYIKGGVFYERFEVLLGDGIFNSDGEKWKQQRRTVIPEFTSRNLREFYAAAYTEVALKLSCILDQIVHQGVAVDMQDLFLRMTFETIGKVGFGVEIGCLPWQLPLPENAFSKATDSASAKVSQRFIDPFWKVKRFLKVGNEAELVHDIEVMDSFTYGVIAQRKLEISAAENQQQAGDPQEAGKLDIITRFLKLAEDEKNGVDSKLIRDICLNFVLAGRDTTGVTLSWLVYSLIQKPEIAQRLHEELRDFENRNRTSESCDNKPVAAMAYVDEEVLKFMKLLTVTNLKTELPYLMAVISETLRLFPAVPEILRVAKEDDVLPDGTRVKKGMVITYSPYSMGRMPYIWGADAKEYKPERWLQEGNFVQESEFKFTAFQAGSRMCMGKDSAYTQMKITLAILYRFYEFQLVKGHNVEYKTMVILTMADGLKVRVRRREKIDEKH